MVSYGFETIRISLKDFLNKTLKMNIVSIGVGKKDWFFE
jgi:hypothetical protein